MPTLRILISLLALAACGQDRRQASTAKPVTQPSSTSAAQPMRDGPQTPLTVAVEVTRGSPAPGTTVELRARVRYVGSWRLPINVDVRMPPGASLVRGNQRVTLQPTIGRNEELIDFAIRIGQVPTDDLVVVADSQSNAGGVHAQAHYRFGRPEPRPVVPARTGPELKTSKANFGRAVPITGGRRANANRNSNQME